ncbi:MAG: hypothetical protein KTR18_03985 [Acidiferrobacterales bacterium]|nr:hypothetical protein [Acidiferrobacterales bacterium]
MSTVIPSFSTTDVANMAAEARKTLSRQTSKRQDRLLSKSAEQRSASRIVTPMSFAELANDPLYRRIAAECCPKDLAERIANLGFDNAARVAAFKSVSRFQDEMTQRSDAQPIDRADLRDLLARSQREARRAYRLMRHAFAVGDPMNQGLRHTPSSISSRLDDPLAAAASLSFAKPSSLQSNQSPAAYLRYLYRIATGLDTEIGIIPDPQSPFSLVVRRPDLARLRLSQSNLKKEVPTLELVNEVLSAGLGDIDVKTSFYPIALPYSREATETRTALAQFEGLRLNDIGMRTMGLDLADYRPRAWAQDQAGLIGLIGALDEASAEGSTMTLLSEDGTQTSVQPDTLAELYRASDLKTASSLTHLVSSLDLDFAGIAQLFGFYAVSQEWSDPAATPPVTTQKDFATAFLANDDAFEIIVDDEGEKSVQMGEAPLPTPVLRSVNYLARLHHASGIAFHSLNQILSLPGASAPAATNSATDETKLASRRVTPTGLRLLASFQLYRDAYSVTPESFAALFGEISPYWRADEIIEGDTSIAGLEQTEISFMRALFGDDAPFVHETVSRRNTPIQDETLFRVVARGFGLSTLEMDALLAKLDARFDLSGALDAQGLGALYRLTTLFRMLGWSILSGLELVESLANQLENGTNLWSGLTIRAETEDDTTALLDAMDWLVNLSHWMAEVDITPEVLLSLLDPGAAAWKISDENATWLEGLTNTAAALKINVNIFNKFETWQDHDGQPTEISVETWQSYLTSINAIYRPSGIFLNGQDTNSIEAACRACLASNSDIVLDDDTNDNDTNDDDPNQAQLKNLVSILDQLRYEQEQLIETQVAALSPSLNVASAGPLIRWTQTSPLDLLLALTGSDDDRSAGLTQLSNIKRHLAAVETFELGDIDLWLLDNRPHWLAPSFADDMMTVKPLELGQLFWLQRFASVQVGAASDDAWRGLFMLTNEGLYDPDASDEEQAQWRDSSRILLAYLMGTTPEDMTTYMDVLFDENAVAQDIVQVEALSRHIRLAEDLKISATELLALKNVSSSDISGAWSAAAAAARSGLSRIQNSDSAKRFRNQLSELDRDALCAAFLQTKIANTDGLKDNITDRESLYRYLLLDVNVSSDVPTSRIVEAISSLQLFISRVLSRLENGVVPIDRDVLAQRWELDKEYRLWEANQKLLLYPQNYIEPELRYITSPEFETLRQAVSGSGISDDSVESAVNTYMNGLASACDLSICSFFADRNASDGGIAHATYHILAKAKWEPGRFFYRKLEADYQTIAELTQPEQYLKAMDWTYWQEVSVPTTFDLFSDVSVCVFDNRFFFFWLELEERREQATATGDTTTESGDNTTTIWRIHPRYMRCDRNALVGVMLIPVLYKNGTLQIPNQTVLGDGAFEWNAGKPILIGTYQPTHLLNGQFHDDQLKNDPGQDTLSITFGIDLPGISAAVASKESERQSLPTLQQTTLRISLSDNWSEAVLDVNSTLNPLIINAAPTGYSPIHAGLYSQNRAISSSDKISERLSLQTKIEEQYLDVNCSYEEDSVLSTISIAPNEIGSDSLGSFLTEINFGQRIYTVFSTNFNALIYGVVEEIDYGPTIISVKLKTTLLDASGNRFEIEEDSWSEYPAKLLSIGNPDGPAIDAPGGTSFKVPLGITAQQLVNFPKHWTPDLFGDTTVTVEAKIRTKFPSLRLFYFNFFADKVLSEVVLPNQRETEETLIVGTFSLFPSKTDIAWSKDGKHGNQNFLHLSPREAETNDDTFVLLNSSSAMSKLARSMPRPGSYESLFDLSNQSDPEDLGNFLQTYPDSLAEIYVDDPTPLNLERTPKDRFDFDSAYGAYGWEVFYHIPSAIAAGFANSGEFDAALRWYHKIFDPKTNDIWHVEPLKSAINPNGALAFDTGDLIVDPDRIATDYPFYYQQATIRHYLETLIEAGDADYETQTQESLQRAKSRYVYAKQLFSENLSETMEVLTDVPWQDPSLGEASADRCDDFLPPYNAELQALYGTIEQRLTNLRRWLDLNGEPMNVPLLATPIDPRNLQKRAKAALTLGGREVSELDLPFSFNEVARSTKGYITNLKQTSDRLLRINEKIGDVEMAAERLDIEIQAAKTAEGLQQYAIDVAEKEKEIRAAIVSQSTFRLARHLTNLGWLFARAGTIDVEAVGTLIHLLNSQINLTLNSLITSTTANIPSIFGFSNGGTAITAPFIVRTIGGIHRSMLESKKSQLIEKKWRNFQDISEKVFDIGENTSALAVDVLSLQKAEKQLTYEREKKSGQTIHRDSMEDLLIQWGKTFSGSGKHKTLKADIEQLYEDEFSETLTFARLLVQIYENDTNNTDGATFIKTNSLGSEVERFNAPHRLSLDIQRLETAYIRAMLDQASRTSELQLSLSNIPATSGNGSAVEELMQMGETYFELTDEMFDLFYPDQYDRRIQSLRICFPHLAEHGLSPHARLTQISNTRFISKDRAQSKRSLIQRDRHALQSLLIGKCEIDTDLMDTPEGGLKCFQNTGVASQWHLEIPMIRALKLRHMARAESSAWRAAATEQYSRLQPHLTEVELTLRFSGRW